MLRGAHVVGRTGAALCVLGLLLVAFVAYQLWGTALYESRAQARLRRELSHELGRRPRRSVPVDTAHHREGATPSDTSPSSARTVQPPGPARGPAPDEPDPPIGSPVGVLTIPAIGLDDVIVEGVGAAQLEQGPGHYPGTPLPGERGNVGIAGHRTTYAHPFYDLNLLHDGDAVDVRTPQGFFHYTVVGSQVVPPTDVGVLAPHGGGATLTLTTCNPRYSAATRLVVTAVFTPGPGRSGGVPIGAAPPPGANHWPATTSHGEPLGDTGGESYWPAVLWGLATLEAALATRVVWRRAPRRLRWAAAVGVPLVAAGLLLCFEHLSLALPPSF
jgi:sortase A